MSEIPSAKRKRMDAGPSDASADTVLIRSKIWMPYGDIVIQAESTQFRVNRDVLARQSSVFKDMFSVPQPPDEPTVEGCPIIVVTDTAKDWELLLEVLYDPFPPKVACEVPLLASMLRLGRKYDMHKARDDAVARFHFEFPADFEGWKTTPNEFTRMADAEGIYIDLLNLAYECEIYTSIPLIGLSCLNTYKLEMLFTGVQRSDGSYATIASDGNKIALAVAAERIFQFQRESMAWLDGDDVIPSAFCRCRTRCAEQKNVLNHIVTWREKNKLDFTYTLESWDPAWSGKLCGLCEEAAKALYTKGTLKGWDLLPTFFGLPGWKDLKDAE